MKHTFKQALRIGAAACVASAALFGCSPSAENSSEVCHGQLNGQSIARRWNEQLLDAIRRDTPAPTVHARNLFHTSAAMWDAWSIYEGVGTQLFGDGMPLPEELRDPQAQEVAISYAAYTVLESRYRNAVGASESLDAFEAELVDQCLDVPKDGRVGQLSEPAQLGIALAETVIDSTFDDGSFELDNYLDLSYVPSSPPLLVAQAGIGNATADDWQPLQLEEFLTQNQIAQEATLQTYIGPHWGSVTPFALEQSVETLAARGAPPRFDTDPAAYIDAAVEVIEYQQRLDTSRDERRDYGPASIGNNPLGTNEGNGWSSNPATANPYLANEMLTADFGRVVAEFWADGPDSETPPGHWNTLANEVSDHGDATHQFRGNGAELDRLEWDVKLYLTLNGAMHDTAIAAWGTKRIHDSARPITIIRYLATLGQSSDETLASYHPNGLPLIDGAIELVTETSASERHAGLIPGTVAVRGWAGHEQLHFDIDEVAWIDARTWVPYQLDTFVTPSFPGYVSGHSAFSRAGAEVLTELTGSAYFPGGLGFWTTPPRYLRFDDGPSEQVTLQWATYADAADQAGESRMYGGIHIAADDFDGRRLGEVTGQQAIAKAFDLFAD